MAHGASRIAHGLIVVEPLDEELQAISTMLARALNEK
jgi:hypothetical protein